MATAPKTSSTPYALQCMEIWGGNQAVRKSISVIEACSPDGEQLGADGLLPILARLDASRPERLADALLDELRGFRGGASPEDDVTVLVLHHNGREPRRQSLAEWSRVLAKMLGLMRV